MRINEFHNNLRNLANIGQSQHLTPEDIDLHINNAVKDLFRQQYKHFEATQEISDTLGFYKVKSNPIDVDANGKIDLPSNYYHITGIEGVMSDDSTTEVEVLSDAHWFKRKFSRAFAPSKIYPIARQIGASKLEALPLENPGIIGVKSIVVYYLRRPADAVYGYVPNTNGTGWAFEQSSSVEVDWPEIDHTRVQDKALGFIGVSLRDNTLIGNESVRKTQNEDK